MEDDPDAMTKGSEHQPTGTTRAQVSSMAGFGARQDEIAAFIGVSEKTLRKHYRQELDTAGLVVNMKVAKALYSQATAGNVSAAIFWMKTRAGWRETTHIETNQRITTVEDGPDLSALTAEELMELHRLTKKTRDAQSSDD